MAQWLEHCTGNRHWVKYIEKHLNTKTFKCKGIQIQKLCVCVVLQIVAFAFTPVEESYYKGYILNIIYLYLSIVLFYIYIVYTYTSSLQTFCLICYLIHYVPILLIHTKCICRQNCWCLSCHNFLWSYF